MNVSHTFSTQQIVKSSNGLLADTTYTSKISGDVTKLNIPFTLPCVVYLYERESMQLLQRTTTSATGYYEFLMLNNSYNYVVLASDPARQYNAVIQDMVRPV